MTKHRFIVVLMIVSSATLAQTPSRDTPTVVLDAPTTFPIVFTKNVGAKTAHPGDEVTARTTQAVRLKGGVIIPKKTEITGHVVAAKPFIYDTTPYAQQKMSVLSIHFDSINVNHRIVPLVITVRAIADPITSDDTQSPLSFDIDPSGTMTQIGGDQRYPWSGPVTDANGDVVAYSRHDGVHAHLIANGGCDGSSVEVSVGIYSASACGLYGFYRTSAEEVGSVNHPSTLTLISRHESPKIWKYSTALLEVLPSKKTVTFTR